MAPLLPPCSRLIICLLRERLSRARSLTARTERTTTLSMLPDKSDAALDVDAVSADRSSESRFADPTFLLSEQAGNAPDQLDLEQEQLKLAKAHDWLVESNLRGSHETSRTRPLEPQDDVVSWSGYGHAALDA